MTLRLVVPDEQAVDPREELVELRRLALRAERNPLLNSTAQRAVAAFADMLRHHDHADAS